MTDGVKIPRHFPCAARVKMPQIGTEASDLTLSSRSSIHQNSTTSIRKPSISIGSATRNINPVVKTYINNIGRELSFSEDVVRDRCFHMLPYDEKYFWEALDVSELIHREPKKNIIVGRHNTSGADKRHMPCISAKPKALKPLTKKTTEKALKMHHDAAVKVKVERQTSSEYSENLEEIPENGIFLTEIDAKESKDGIQAKKLKKTLKVKPEIDSFHDNKEKEPITKEKKPDWDAYLMSIISPMTANWIVHQRMTGGGKATDKEELSKLLVSWYGKPEHTDLIRDDVSETDLQQAKTPEKQPKKIWKKEEAILLEKVLKTEPVARDPYSDENEAPFYRQPVGFRKQRKKIEKEELGAINSTARDIEVKTYELPPPPTLRDFFNPKAGDTLIQTDNMFEREWLTGNQQIYQGPNEEVKIVMSSQNKYRKQLRKEYPGVTETWFTETGEEVMDVDSPRYFRPTKGSRRWKALPEPVDDTVEILKCLPPGTEPKVALPADAKMKKVKQQNPALSQIIDEWRSKWQLSGQFADSSPNDLLRDMADIQPHIRLKAIATVAKAAEYKPPVEDGIQLEYQDQQNDAVSRLPDYIFEALNCLCDDKHDQVKKAAAVTLYALDKPSDKAEEILRDLLFSESLSDRWAASQCLAHFGVCDSDVAGEIIRQLLATEDAIKHEQSIQLLAKMSASTTLIHSMVAEQLNSSSWRHRVIACKIFPTLDGTINKDIANKLSNLMWKDWHVEVRKSAAQTLGKTGHGRNVHDDLREKIQGNNERLKLEAISRVGHLGIMTAKLLPVMLECFEDEYISVRMEVCITCGNLGIKDEIVINKLRYLATFDPAWKVKALAIQALGKIGVSSPEIFDVLMWALRYEEEGGVRAEACHTLLLLDYKGDDFIEILQERLLVEDSDAVQQEMRTALKYLGFNSSEDIDTVAQIKSEVRKLCDQGIIASMILSNDRNEEKRRALSRMIYNAQQELGEEEIIQEVNKSLQITNSPTWNIRTDNADQSLEGDKEIEAILSPHIVDRSTPESGIHASSQSSDADEDSDAESPRPLTSLSAKSRMDKIPEETDFNDTKTDFNDTKSEIDLKLEFDNNSELDYTSSGGKSQFLTRDNTTGSSLRDETEVKVDMNRLPDPTVNLQPDPIGYKSPMTSSVGEMRGSALSMGGSVNRRQIMSRETIQEREKINAEARKHLLTLNARYSSMIDNLKKIDDGLSADQTQLQTESEKIISNISI